MALTEISGVLGRYFHWLVGFFLPAYVSLVALWIAASESFVPDALVDHSNPQQLLILGGVALVTGLALSSLNRYVTRVFAGYPLDRVSSWPLVGLVPAVAVGLQRRHYDRLRAIRDDKCKPDKARARAAWVLDRFFPHDRDDLLPTRVGNAVRAFEQHSNLRWGLDGVAIWPRIEALMTAEERELHVDSKFNFCGFLNAAVGALAVGGALIVDKALNAPEGDWSWALYAIPFAVAYLLYRAAIGPAADWGDAVRSSIDLHRLELYEKLGVRAPTSFSDERGIADRVNKALVYGHPLLGDDLWRGENPEQEPEKPGRRGCLARLFDCRGKGGTRER